MSVSTRLSSDLRSALATLYSINGGHNTTITTHDAAHKFLMHFQSRNVRRKLRSMKQSQKDQKKKSNERKSMVDNAASNDDVGSSWLASLAVLCQADAHPTEQLFCAQTLANRLRRVTIAEAVDWEMEVIQNQQQQQQQQPAQVINVQQMVQLYMEFLKYIDSNFAAYMSHQMTQSNNCILDISDEQQVKGELSMATLGYIAYRIASSQPLNQHTQPLLTTLGASMSAIALRLRYTPQSVAEQKPANSSPIVQMVLQPFFRQNNADCNQSALFLCRCYCLGAIPDTILASPGGARGKLSADPKCLSAAYCELCDTETGAKLLWGALLSQQELEQQPQILEMNMSALLWTCERWVKFLPVPWEFLEPTINFARQYLARRESLLYVNSILESGALTPQEILSMSLGLSSDQQSHQPNKKRQSSKSKKRQKERLKEGATETRCVQVEAESRHRGEMAFRTFTLIWHGLQLLLHSPTLDTSSEGPIGCLCACANVCLPFLVKHGNGAFESSIQQLAHAFQEVCGHPDRNVRALTYEPLTSLHSSLKRTEQISSDLENFVVNHLFQSSLKLIVSCSYPLGYFQNMSRQSDEDLEIERNDVRDVLRAVAGSYNCDGTKGMIPWRVLDGIIRSCATAITQQRNEDGLPPETAVHALSALAKPINQLTEVYCKDHISGKMKAVDTLSIAYRSLKEIADLLCQCIPNKPMKSTFPISRLHCLAMASLAPSFASVCKMKESSMGKVVDPALWSGMTEALRSGMCAAAISAATIPELAAPSVVSHAHNDIVGAMTSPGGEDHVGVLVFMRFATEAEELARTVFSIGNQNGSSLLFDLCNLHNQLKQMEKERGPGVHHGKGVTPKARRILMQTISTFVAISRKSPALPSNNGRDIDSSLQEMLNSTIRSVSAVGSSNLNELALHHLCELTFDIASFSKEAIHKIVDADFLAVIKRAAIHGYGKLSFTDEHDGSLVQWGRLRAALVTLVCESAMPDLPMFAADLVATTVPIECQAIVRQCEAGPSAPSSIFNENVISENMVSAGALVMAVGQVLKCADETKQSSNLGICIDVLCNVHGSVLDAILRECPEPMGRTNLVDPRPTVCESWYLALSSVAEMAASNAFSGKENNVLQLLGESLSASILLFLYSSFPRDGEVGFANKGMSLDGPHTLAMLKFQKQALRLGPAVLNDVSGRLANRVGAHLVEPCHGGSIFIAALLRAASGGLPPWAVEGLPSVFSGLFDACGKNVTAFGRLLKESTAIRLAPSTQPVGGVRPGSLLSGSCMQQLRDAAKDEFYKKTLEICKKDSSDSWRRFKTLLKHTCGGKKKQTDFNLKPSPTCWECDRI